MSAALATTAPAEFDDERRHAPRDIVRWLDDVLGRSAKSLSLRQQFDHGELLVRTWEIAPDLDVERLALAIDQRTQSDGSKLRGSTNFVLYAFAGGREHIDRMIIRVDGELFLRNGETESPTAAGITSQMMRHTEVATRTALGQTANVIEYYTKLLARADARNAALETQLADQAALHEAVLNEQHIRKLEEEKLARELELKRAALEQLSKYAPFVLKEAFGGAPALPPSSGNPPLGPTTASLPPAAAGAIDLLSRLLGSLSSEQTKQITALFSPDQTILFGELILELGKLSSDPNVVAKANEPTPVHQPPPSDIAAPSSPTNGVSASTIASGSADGQSGTTA